MKKSVLVVEDEFDGQQVVNQMLNYLDIETTLAYNAEDALNHLEHEAFDGILLDLGLPGMDGIMFLRTVRQMPALQDIPCIVLTAYNSGQVKRDAFEAGCDAFLPKPVNTAIFEEEINRLIKKQL